MNARAGFTTTKHRRVIVTRTQMIGCDWQKLAAWTPTTAGMFVDGAHESYRYDDAGTLMGMIGTERIDVNGLPALTTRRLWTVRAHYAERVALAHALILRAFPEIAGKTETSRFNAGAELHTHAKRGTIGARSCSRNFLVPAYLLEC